MRGVTFVPGAVAVLLAFCKPRRTTPTIACDSDKIAVVLSNCLSDYKFLKRTFHYIDRLLKNLISVSVNFERESCIRGGLFVPSVAPVVRQKPASLFEDRESRFKAGKK